MRKQCLVLALALAGVSSAQASDGGLPFMKDLANGHELPRPYGVGMDVFTMHQDYEISSLTFSLPGVTLPDPSVISVKNHIVHTDIQADAWLFPFLDVFVVAGHVTGETEVDLSGVTLPIPVTLGTLPVRYEGGVYGGGVTLVAGGEHWFTSLTGSWTRTSLNGDFASSEHARSLQPRVGYINGAWQAWLGAMNLKVREEHAGVFELPGIGSVPFAVELREKAGWTPAIGVRYVLDRALDASFEVGGGDRRTTLLNVTWRFPKDSE